MKRQNRDSGVITLEAAIMMPMFILLMLFLYGFFIFFMGQQIMSHTAIQTAKSLSFDPYSVDRIGTDAGLAVMIQDVVGLFNDDYSSTVAWYSSERSERLPSVAKDRFLALLPNQANRDGLLKLVGVENGVGGLDFSGSKVEDGVLTFKLKYVQNFPFKVADITAFDREITLKARLFDWIDWR